MKEELCPCRYCKCKAAETYKIEDLWYVRCRGSRKVFDKVSGKYIKKPCNKWLQYEFLGLTEKDAIDNWNLRNTQRGVYNDE